MTTLSDLELSRQAEHDQIDTDADLDAFEAAAYWQALRRYRVPRLLAAALVIRRAGTQAVVAHVAAEVEE